MAEYRLHLDPEGREILEAMLGRCRAEAAAACPSCAAATSAAARLFVLQGTHQLDAGVPDLLELTVCGLLLAADDRRDAIAANPAEVL